MSVFSITVLILLAYLIWQNWRTRDNLIRLAATIDQRFDEYKESQKVVERVETLGYEWHEDGWPYKADEEDAEFAFENPTPYHPEDDYADGLLLAEYKSLPTPPEKKAFLKRLIRTRLDPPVAIADEVFNDSVLKVWAASHLNLVYKDYSGKDWENAATLRDFEFSLRDDPNPIVRAALFSNPNYSQLPWDWYEGVKGRQGKIALMSQLERLALMRNPKLSARVIVTLMEEIPEHLQMTVDEQASMICAAAVNPTIVNSSRETGRDFWVYDRDANSPVEEYGQMWRLALDRWQSSPQIAYHIFKYVQTTPAVKLETYNRLKDDSDNAYLRQAILGSCEPMKDKEILKLGWSDPDKECCEIAKWRIGGHTAWVGVK